MKCFLCKKKTLILLQCKCEKKFCITHLPRELHKCEHVHELFVIEKIVKDKIVKI